MTTITVIVVESLIYYLYINLIKQYLLGPATPPGPGIVIATSMKSPISNLHI